MKEFQLTNIVKILFSNARKILIVSLFTFTVSAIIALFFLVPKYESTAQILSSSSSNNVNQSSLAGIAAGFGVNLPIDGAETVFSSDLYSSIILSNHFLENLLSKRFIDYHDGDNKLLLDIIITKDNIPSFDRNKLALESLKQDIIKVTKDPRTGIVSITTETFNRKFSQELCEAIIIDLNEFQQKFTLESAQKKKTFIENRIVEVDKDLHGIEKELSDFYESNINYKNSPKLVIEKNRIQTKYDVSKGVFITLNQEYEMARIEEVKETQFLKVIDKPGLAFKKSYPLRKQIVIWWTMLITIIFSFWIVLRESKNFMNTEDLEKIRELKKILKNQMGV